MRSEDDRELLKMQQLLTVPVDSYAKAPTQKVRCYTILVFAQRLRQSASRRVVRVCLGGGSGKSEALCLHM